MGLRDQMSNDLTTFFDEDGFAQAATWWQGMSGHAVSVIFDNPRSGLAVMDDQVAEYVPQAQCAASAVSGIAIGDVLEIDGTFYNITNVAYDMDGLVATLVLSKD